MSSEIGEKSLLKRVADALKIIDPRQMASRLKTDEVIPVVDISRWIGTAPIDPPAADQWQYITQYFSQDMVGLNAGTIDVMTDFYGPDIVVRLLTLDWRLELINDVTPSSDYLFGFHLKYPADEGSQRVIDFPIYDYLTGSAESRTELRYAMHGSVITSNKPIEYRPAVPVWTAWQGLIPPNKHLQMVWNTGAVVPGDAYCLLDIAATYVYGPTSLGVPPI